MTVLFAFSCTQTLLYTIRGFSKLNNASRWEMMIALFQRRWCLQMHPDVKCSNNQMTSSGGRDAAIKQLLYKNYSWKLLLQLCHAVHWATDAAVMDQTFNFVKICLKSAACSDFAVPFGFTFSTWKRPLLSDSARNEQQNTNLENMYLITYNITTVLQNKIHPSNLITFVQLHFQW